VSAALPQLQADGITARWRFNPPNAPVTPDITTPPPGDYYIVGGQPLSPGVIWFQTQPQPLSANPGAQEAAQQYDEGC